MTEIKLCAIYTRVSTLGQAKEGESLSTQLRSLKEFAGKKGWEVADIYSDEGASGKKATTRPAFMRMIADAKERKFQAIIFTKLSRFARNAGDFIRYSEDLKGYGVSVFPIDEGVDPTSRHGQFLMQFISVFAAWEKDMIQERTQENRVGKWREGRLFMGRTPFGYARNPDTGTLIINKDEARIYHEIVEMYLDKCIPIEEIVLHYKHKLNGSGRVKFTHTFIRGMLQNTIYYGSKIYNQYAFQDGKRGAGTDRARNEDGSYKYKPQEEHIIYSVEPIISKAKWDEIQQRFEFNKRKRKRSTDNSSWLVNLLECGYCSGKRGHPSTIKPVGGNGRPRYYRCYWSNDYKHKLEMFDHERCRNPYIPADILEKKVWDNFMLIFTAGGRYKSLKALFDSDPIKAQIADMKNGIGEMRSTLTSKRKKMERAIESTLELPKDDSMRSVYDDMARKLRDEVITLESRITENEERLRTLGKTLEDTEAVYGALKDKDVLKGMVQSLRKFNAEDKKRLFEALVDGKIKVRAERVDAGHDLEDKRGRKITTGKEVLDIQLQYKFRPNINIFKQFVDEGKLSLNSVDFHGIDGCIILDG